MTMFVPSVASGRRGARIPVALALMCAGATLAVPLAAQDRGSGRTLEHSQALPSTCGTVPRTIEPSPQERIQASKLASAARQSVVLGDLEQARSLLIRAVQLDPTAPNVPYYLARVLDDQGESELALAEYCRTLALGAPRDEAAFARERIEALADREGLEIFDDATAAQVRIPDDATAAQVRIPDDAIAERQRTPDDPNAEEQPNPDRAIAPSPSPDPLRSRPAPGVASPTAALTLGMLIPGLGQYYAGKPVRGAVVASLAIGALASGFFVQKRSIGCLEPVGSGQGCPPDDVVRVQVSRPYLTTGIAVAGGVALLGALDAYFGAREQRTARSFSEDGGPHVEGPSISSGEGVAELRFLTIRMR